MLLCMSIAYTNSFQHRQQAVHAQDEVARKMLYGMTIYFYVRGRIYDFMFFITAFAYTRFF